MGKSSRPTPGRKSSDSRPAFPLFKHQNGRWCKKVRGKHHYFGKIADDPDGQRALGLWLEVKDDLLAGRTPQKPVDGLTLEDLLNRFLHWKRQHVEAGELSERTWADYRSACRIIVGCLGRTRPVAGLSPADFERLRVCFTRHGGPHRVGKLVQTTRTIFKYGVEAGYIEQAVRFGPGFKRPPKHVLRKHRVAQGPKMFSAEEIRSMLETAKQPLRCMILLAVNCGFGNSDCARLPVAAVDLCRGWIDFPRPKTGIERRCPLWPETVEALREVLERGPRRRDLVFVTRRGNGFGKHQASITHGFRKLLDSLQLHRRDGLGFYTLRHVFRTVADATRDWPAVRLIMGHCDASIDDLYREMIDDARLMAVAEHVRRWLFGRLEPKRRGSVQ